MQRFGKNVVLVFRSLVFCVGAHSRPTTNIYATMMPQLGVVTRSDWSMPEPRDAGNRVRRDYRHHDYAAEKREAWVRLATDRGPA